MHQLATLIALPVRARRAARLLALVCSGLSCLPGPALAQVFKLQCSVEGKVPALDDLKLPAAKVTVELQTIGKHLYFNVVGPRPYDMRVSSLETEAYLGTNLTSSSRLGARRKNRATEKETEIIIDRSSVELTAHNDTDYQGKAVRVDYAGKCKIGA